jgi:sulfur-carrier protein
VSIRVRLFAALRDIAGSSELAMDASTVGGLCDQLSERFGGEFARTLRAGSVVVDGRTAGRDRRLDEGDEVAVLPPVSGGGGGMMRAEGPSFRSASWEPGRSPGIGPHPRGSRTPS